MENTTSIGSIGNYYGGLFVKEEDGKYYWGISNYDGTGWEEIPKKLYKALLKFEKRGMAKDSFY